MWWKIIIFVYIVLGMIVTLMLSNKQFNWKSIITDINIFLIWPFWAWMIIKVSVLAYRNPEFVDRLTDFLEENLNSVEDIDQLEDIRNKLKENLKDEKDKKSE